MTIAAIIAEYNPFHNGHEYMIKKVKEETGADYIIAAMSGDFTQRGIPGIADKHTRAKMAVSCGVDAVFELPVRFATANAEIFATGGVALFHALSCVDYLAFGSECGKLSEFSRVSEFLQKEPEEFKEVIKRELRKGVSYPRAFSTAVKEYSQLSASAAVPDANSRGAAPDSTAPSSFSTELLEHPNNLLGLEYMKALKKHSSRIKPHTIARTGTGYHDSHSAFSKEADTLIASASAIRAALESKTGSIALAQPLLPDEAYRTFAESYGISAPVSLDDFSLLLSMRIATETKDSLATFLDVPKELADRIYSFRDELLPFTELISAIKHKQYTYARINRALLHILLGLKETLPPVEQATAKTDFAINLQGSTAVDVHTEQFAVPYARLLAMKKSSSPLLKELKACSKIPVITKPADARKLLTQDALTLFLEDVAAADLYNRVTAHKFNTKFVTDMRHSIELA